MALGESRLFEHLSGARRILLAGAGGGCDVYCAIPLYLALRERGAEVHLGNLTFADLSLSEALGEALHVVRASDDTRGEYAPERHLASWLSEHGIDAPVYGFGRVGVRPLTRAYRELAARLALDAIVLVDGGTDALMRGDEFHLATPEEDVASILAASSTDVRRKALVCTAFGVDSFHGICHAQFLENVAELSREGAYLGAFSFDAALPEVQAYLQAVQDLCAKQPRHQSVVNTSMASAIEGHYGDHHRSHRTAGSRLWISPLMALAWCFELGAVASRIQYRDRILDTDTYVELSAAIGEHRAGIFHKRRPFEEIPA
jgi:hypothetical protein